MVGAQTRSRAEALSETGVVQVLAVGTAAPSSAPCRRLRYRPHGAHSATQGWTLALLAVTTHNPFVVNDLWLCRELGLDPKVLNRYYSLIYGHPQAPTGMRGVVELVEALTLRGGGLGMFTGCAAGDSAAGPVVLRVEVRS